MEIKSVPIHNIHTKKPSLLKGGYQLMVLHNHISQKKKKKSKLPHTAENVRAEF